MKKGIIYLIFSALLMASCDPCNKVTCYNGGECLEGVCDCSNGYEGESCNVITANKYIGTWYGTGTDGQNSSAVNWTITRGKEINYLLVDGDFIISFNGENLSFLGAVNPEPGYTYGGSGTITENKLNFTLSINDGSDTYVFTYVLSK